jgi:arylsulfatase A-like enzyme
MLRIWNLGIIVVLAILHLINVAVAGATQPESPRPLNVIFVLCDQEAYHIRGGADYALPARQALQKRGVTFHNHYIGSAVCTPSRALIFTGQPPQINGVYDHLAFGFVPSLSPAQPSLGTMMKEMGYHTAYFGKFELSTKVLAAKRTDNTSTWLQPYGFDVYNADGDNHGAAYDGFVDDPYIAGSSIRWMRANVPQFRKKGEPFFMVMSLVNPHDIMFADANVPGKPAAQKPIGPGLIAPPPNSAIYERRWDFKLPPSFNENLKGPGMPAGVYEYDKGWSGIVGSIPPDRKDMWHAYCNHYLNCLRDSDRTLQQVWDALDDMNLWKDTVVVLTADHGDMAGTHGLRGKGPLCYENNAHVPLVIAHPHAKAGKGCAALTSHLDLVPTFVGMTNVAKDRRPAPVGKLPGRDFSKLLADPENANVNAIRPGVLFNYVSLTTVDADYSIRSFVQMAKGKRSPDITEVNRDKRGFLAFTFDGRYKLGRFYSPNGFNTPTSLDELFKQNDVQVFDLKNDPEEMQNLALDRDKHKDTILRLNGLLNDLMAREVGVNDGRFLPESVRPKNKSAD